MWSLQRAAVAACLQSGSLTAAGAAASTSGAAACGGAGRLLHSLCAPGPLSQAPEAGRPWLPQPHDQEAPGSSGRGSGSGGGSDIDHSSGSGGAAPPGAQPQGPWGRDPILCGHPKDKISVHRRGVRRQPYYKKPQGLLAFCRFCQSVGGPHEQLQSGGRCNGRCFEGAPKGTYRPEYKQPC